jgi:hypothetical protein
MSQLSETSVATRDVVLEAQRTALEDVASTPPVLITEQEVMFGTRAALSSRVASVPHRLIDTMRSAVASLRLPPPHQHYPANTGYLEHSRMAREMYRL